VLVTACYAKEPKEIDFLPLTVEYKEYQYAAGRIPGGFFKREGRPTEKEILTCRMIDRPIRPLFPEGFNHETQVVALVLSADGENDPDVLAINGAAAALAINPIPFPHPRRRPRRADRRDARLQPDDEGARAVDDRPVVVRTPTPSAWSRRAQGVPENVMLGAILAGHRELEGDGGIEELARRRAS
jgi:polyribonucleotide nucleotidyltransferase